MSIGELLELSRENDRLEAENTRLRKALEFYADEKIWTPRHHALTGMNPEADIEGENGVIAREALKEVNMFPIVTDPNIPHNEVHFKNGEITVGKIINTVKETK